MSDPQLPDENLVRGALEARAATATVAPDAWDRLEQARGRPSHRRSLPPGWSGRPMLVAAAAAAAVLLVVALGITGAQTASRLDMSGDPPERTEPEPVVTDSDEPAPTGTTPGTTPGTTVAPAVTEAPVDGLGDLRNAAYPSTLCPEAEMRMPGETFRLVDGEANGSVGDARTHVELLQSAIADLDGDGRREALGRFRCGAWQTDWLVDFVVVLGEGADGPVVLAKRTSSGADPTALYPTVTDALTETVVMEQVRLFDGAADVAVQDDRLVAVTWDQSRGVGSNVGYFQQVVTYRWTGRELSVVGVGERRRTGPPLGNTEELFAIRGAGIRSMTVPLAAGAQNRPRLCDGFFSSDPPLQDVALVDGRATVPGAGGAGVDGSLAITDHRFGVVAGTTEDAVVVVQCELPRGRRMEFALVRLIAGRPTMVDVWASASGVLDNAPMTIQDLYGGQVRINQYDRESGTQRVVTYQWDGSHLVRV